MKRMYGKKSLDDNINTRLKVLILRQDNRHRFSTALSLGGFHKKV
jgi:hypothetical protein